MFNTKIKIILFVLLFGLGSSVFADETQDLDKIKETLEAKKKALLQTKKKEQEALVRLVGVKKELKNTKYQLVNTQSKLTVASKNIHQLSLDIAEAKQTLDKESSKLKKRIQEIFKGSQASNLEILLSSTSMSDFVNRSYYFNRILDRDSTLIDDIIKKYSFTRDKRHKLEQQKTQMTQAAVQILKQKNLIAEKAEEEQQLYATLKDRRQRYEQQVEELERSSEELERMIQAKLASRKKQGIKSTVGSGKFAWPLKGRITSPFGVYRRTGWGRGHRHTGLDIAAPHGSPIRASDGGEVIFTGWWNGYGKAVVIDHGRGFQTVYAHLSRIYAKNGSSVSQGQVIGLEGSTGYSTGPHLHFEVRKNGKAVNPMTYLR